MIKCVKVCISIFFLKHNNKFVFHFIKFKPRHKHAKWLPSDLTPWTLTLAIREFLFGFKQKSSFLVKKSEFKMAT